MTLQQIEELSKKAIELRDKATQGEWTAETTPRGPHGQMIYADAVKIPIHHPGSRRGTFTLHMEGAIFCDKRIVPSKWDSNLHLIAFSANHLAEIAEMNLRLVRALDKCKEQRDQCFEDYRHHENPASPEEIAEMIMEDNVKIQAILEGRDV